MSAPDAAPATPQNVRMTKPQATQQHQLVASIGIAVEGRERSLRMIPVIDQAA